MISYEELAKAIAEERFEISVWQFDQMMRVFEDADPDFERSDFLDVVQGVKTCEKPFLYLVVNKQ
jgi:hypothetical protein